MNKQSKPIKILGRNQSRQEERGCGSEGGPSREHHHHDPERGHPGVLPDHPEPPAHHLQPPMPGDRPQPQAEGGAQGSPTRDE